MAAGPEIAWPAKRDVLGVGVSVTDYAEATAAIFEAARRRESAVVSCHAVHALVTFSADPTLRSIVNRFEMIAPDGQPVRWALRLLHGVRLADRVYGPELMLRLCREAGSQGIPVFLCGGTPTVLDALQTKLRAVCPGLVIAGAEAPPFRPLTAEERQGLSERIQASGAALVFIGLGCPKQDLLAHDLRGPVRGVWVCVGAAFDLHAGVKRMAPAWMQRLGLEWFYRLVQEPRRLWRRYLVTNTIFLAKVVGRLVRSPLPPGKD
jgi:exopolysaccharide biosynthesis WecB/TagA/CpsF family protein